MSGSLAARRLWSSYGAMRATAFLGGSSNLYALVRESIACAEQLMGDERVVAFALAKIFDDLAMRYDGAALTAETAAILWSQLDQPIAACIDFVSGKPFAGTLSQLLVAVVDAFLDARSKVA